MECPVPASARRGKRGAGSLTMLPGEPWSHQACVGGTVLGRGHRRGRHTPHLTRAGGIPKRVWGASREALSLWSLAELRSPLTCLLPQSARTPCCWPLAGVTVTSHSQCVRGAWPLRSVLGTAARAGSVTVRAPGEESGVECAPGGTATRAGPAAVCSPARGLCSKAAAGGQSAFRRYGGLRAVLLSQAAWPPRNMGQHPEAFGVQLRLVGREQGCWCTGRSHPQQEGPSPTHQRDTRDWCGCKSKAD